MQNYRNRVNRSLETAADRARRFRWRIRLMTGLFAAFFIIIAGQAVFLMVMPSDERLSTLARRQHQQVVTLYPKRGTIYDRNGTELALSVEMDSVYADPKFVTAPDAAAKTLAPLLELPEHQLKARLTQPLRFVWLARRVGPKVSETIDAAKIPGVYTVAETRRFYPNRELAGALLGFTNIDNVGIEGLERAYNDALNGQVTRYVRLRDAKGRNVTPEGVLVKQNIDGGHLVLTLDRTLQFAAEQALNNAFVEFNAKGGFVIVMDPKTGEILAVANAPGYNPNAYNQYAASAFKNQAVANSFEPGSTQKSFLVAAALEDRVIRPNDRIDCEGGNYRIGRNVIHDTHEYGVLSIEEIIQFSSNIGSAKIGDKLGKQRLYDYYRAFGFGESTRCGLPGEINGLVRDPKRWSRIGLATHAFGQGMTVTGMQIASALSAIANGGVRMKPHIVKAIKDQHGNVVERFEPVELGRVVSDESARQITKFLSSVTSEGGTGTKARIEGYTVAGKTGTAQKVDPVLRRYAPGIFVSSFVGFVPAEDPRLVIVAVLDEPRGGHYYGGTVSAPIFAEVARVGMRHLGVPPTAPVVVDPSKPAKKTLVAKVTLPEGEDLAASDQDFPELKPVADAGGEVVEEYILPDFTGQTMRSVLSALDDKLFNLRINGSGLVVSQMPKAGETISSGETLTVVFSQDGIAPAKKKTGQP